MRALVVAAHGSAPEPWEVPEPAAAAGRALVRVRAVALNPVDLRVPPQEAPGAWARLAAGADGDKLVVVG